tara:strand:- start:710 stop:1315 length:606 start_codon:yes stop_codon:yes gene_type:complete
MSLSHINNIKRSDLDKHIHIKYSILYKIIPNKDVIYYILNIIIKEDKYWVDLGYEITNIKYLWIEYYFNIILNSFGTSDYITLLFNKIETDYINIKNHLDNTICDKYNNLKYLPEYPNIKITKLFYNLLDIHKPYTVKIRGIYPKKISIKNKNLLLQFINININFLKKIKKIFTKNNLLYINRINKHLNNLLITINNIDIL